jgi:superfamily II DNA/RNA helicase
MIDRTHNAQHDPHAGFQELGVDPNLIAALERLDLSAPTEIQQRVIPAALEGRDCLVRACTGAGKTNAYLLPILQRVSPGRGLQALVIQPTRSLALQLERNLRRFAPECPLRTAVVVGGRRTRGQPDPLADAPEVLIATPRGAAELVRRGHHDWSTLRILVVDDADAILDDRGPEQLRRVYAALEQEHQTIVVAGDLNEPVRGLAEALLHDPIEVDLPPGPPRAMSATHAYVVVDPKEKLDALVALCRQQAPKLAILLANSEPAGRDLVRRLTRLRVSCRWIAARRPPRRPDQRGRQPKRPRGEVIVAADPVPRRLATIPASHLLHYELPNDAEVYMHRLRQAARLRRDGSVIAFVEPGQEALLEEIERRTGKPFKKLETPFGPARRPRAPTPPASNQASNRSTNTDSSSTGRLGKVLHRDEELESRGVKPVRRTLGNRFRSPRRGKPLRRPGPPR